MDSIKLTNMAFYGRHGNINAEHELGQRFFVDIILKVDLSKAGQTDDLNDTVDYGKVYGVIKEVVENECYNLLERVGTVICERIWGHFDNVVGLSVTLRKPSAPIPGILDHAEVTINRGSI